MVVNLTFFEMSEKQKVIASFGRKMIAFQEKGGNGKTPLEILNAFSRIGEEMAETASMKNLSDTDKMVVKYARSVM